MILDAHCHLGNDVVFDVSTNEEELLENFSAYGIDGGIIQPFLDRIYIETTRESHDRIYRFCLQAPTRYFGMASINPHFNYHDYEKEAERCVKELGFVGIKITPIGHSVHPASKDALHVMEVARRLKVPVMIHTGMGIPFSDPAAIRTMVGKFPDVKIIIAHAGANFYTTQAVTLAQDYDNIFIEPSGAGIEATEHILNKIGPRRVMFSSDVRIQTPMELTKYRTLLKKQADLDQVFYKTAVEVFQLNINKD